MNNSNNYNASSSPSIDSAIVYSAISASVVATSLLAAQSDFLSRKFLSPLKLYAKRRQDQVYKLDKAIAESIQRIRYHVNECNHIDSSIERKVMDVILDKEEISRLVKEICTCASSSSTSRSRRSSAVTGEEEARGSSSSNSAGSVSPPLIVGISKDLNMAKEQYYIHLAFPLSSTGGTTSTNATVQYGRRVQIPLVTFCETLATELESILTSNAMCFLADASSSLSSHVFTTLFQKCQTSLQIPLVQEPSWMTTVALLLRRREISPQEGEKILYALCRLEVLKLDWEQKIGSKHKTVVFVLPGQGCTQILLEVLQKLFPCERHVFAYDGCVDSVRRGLWCSTSNQIKEGTGSEAFYAMPRSVSATVPLVPMMKKLPQLPDLLAKLPKDMASVVEAWMSSVDAMIVLKEDERKNMYTPFVCRMEFLLKGDNRVGENGELSLLEERGRLALGNVLQYITGSRSRALDDATLDAAQSVLMDLRREWRKDVAGYSELSQSVRTDIEDCVFLHKMILIGDKTLPDTVIPKVEWSLKAAKKLTSCACCFPGEEDDENEDGSKADEDQVVDEFAVSIGNTNSRNGYVDGKTKFAFDPSLFTGMK